MHLGRVARGGLRRVNKKQSRSVIALYRITNKQAVCDRSVVVVVLVLCVARLLCSPIACSVVVVLASLLPRSLFLYRCSLCNCIVCLCLSHKCTSAPSIVKQSGLGSLPTEIQTAAWDSFLVYGSAQAFGGRLARFSAVGLLGQWQEAGRSSAARSASQKARQKARRRDPRRGGRR